MTKKLDPHGDALDILYRERADLERTLKTLKPRINNLMRFKTAKNEAAYGIGVHLWGGDISTLTKQRNELRRRLKSVEESRSLLRRDRALQMETAWEDEQFALMKKEVLERVSLYNCLYGC